MNFETVKSFILWILVAISLLLTFSLWNYQPNLKSSNSGKQYVDQVDLGGKEVTKQEVIEPKSFIFHNGETYYGFSNPHDIQSLYHDMHKWVLYNVQISEQQGKPSQEKQVEIIFPVPIPMQMAKSLFTFREDNPLPKLEWSFDKIYLTFNTEDSVLNVIFISQNGEQRVTASVNNSKKYDKLWRYLTTFEGLTEYKLVKSGSRPFYVPKHQVQMNRKVLTINTIDPWDMVDALFIDSEVVSRNQVNQSEVYFTDGFRDMEVFEHLQLMKFKNPYQSSSGPLSDVEMTTQSIQSINGRKGWTGGTGEYNLMGIDSPRNVIRYQMYYGGYPIYSNVALSIIEQKWHTTEISVELNRYNRPLFQLNNLINEQTVTLKSADEVLEQIGRNSSYNLKNISGLRVGYQLNYQDIDTNNVVKLEPGWFLKSNGKWHEVNFEEKTQHLEGGAEGAMETD